MMNFLSIRDVDDLEELLQEARHCKQHPFADVHLGKNKTLGLIFLNPSLRTRLSTQRAAYNLGMHVMVMNMGSEGWALEMEDGTVMEGDKSEHIREAAAVIGQYCDIIGLRSFPGLKDRTADYGEQVLGALVKYAKCPVINLESATLHPLQSLADVLTIEQYKRKARPKVVLTWAPHPKALPQSVPNSFAQWMNRMNYDFIIANPEGYDLAPEFTGKARILHDPEEAYRQADFIYAKNWSSYSSYGQILSRDPRWTVDAGKMRLTNNAYFMHCLPVRRNVVVTDEVIDSPNSIVIEEANNRTFAAQSVIKKLLISGRS
jgi:N-succinyl-L-ornithine transcarbamylase